MASSVGTARTTTPRCPNMLAKRSRCGSGPTRSPSSRRTAPRWPPIRGGLAASARTPGIPGTSLTRLARNPGAWGNSTVRETAPAPLRTARDGYARDELRAVLQVWATLQGQYGAAVALEALTDAVQRGRTVVADATVLAQRRATWGPDHPADPGPNLTVYDQLLAPGAPIW